MMNEDCSTTEERDDEDNIIIYYYTSNDNDDTIKYNIDSEVLERLICLNVFVLTLA